MTPMNFGYVALGGAVAALMMNASEFVLHASRQDRVANNAA